MAKDVTRGIKLYIDGKEVKNNATAIKADLRRLNKEIDSMTIGSKEYVAQTRKIQTLRSVLSQHQAGLRGVDTQIRKNSLSMGKMVDGFNKYFGVITTGIAAVSALMITFNSMKKNRNEKESAAANLKALTGLDDKSIVWLTKQAEELSQSMTSAGVRIQASSKEILEAYMLVGSAKPDLLQNKTALAAVTKEALVLATAAKMDVKEAVDGITMAMNQYGAAAGDAARYTNVLAAGSKYGSASVQSQTTSIIKAGVAASTARVPIEQLVGSIQALAEKGIKDEIAGTQLKTFFIRLETGARETRPSVVGLQKALETLKAQELDSAEIQKRFGLETYSVAKAMIDGVEKVKSYTKAVTDTSVATEQARINSNTTEAKMAQMRNELTEAGIRLVDRLAPAMGLLVTHFSRFIKVLPDVIDSFRDYGSVLAWFTATILLNVAAKKAEVLWTTRATVAQGEYAGAVLLTGLRHRMALAASFAFRTVVLLLTGRVKEAVLAFKALNRVMLTNPYVMILSAAVALGYGIYKLIEYTHRETEAMRLQRQAHQDMADVQTQATNATSGRIAKIRILTAVIHDNTRSLSDRRAAIEQLARIVPGYTAQIDKEGRVIAETTANVKNYIKELRNLALEQAMTEKLTALEGQKLTIAESRQRRQNALKIRQDRLSLFRHNNQWANNYELKESWLGYSLVDKGNGYSYLKGSKLYGREREQRGFALGQLRGLMYDVKEAQGWVDESNAVLRGLDSRQTNIVRTAKKMGLKPERAVISDTSSGGIPSEPTPTTPTASKPVATSEKVQQKAMNAVLERIETEHLSAVAKLKKEYLESDSMTQQQYAQKLETLETDKLARQLDVAGLEPKKREEINNAILEAKLKISDKIKELNRENTLATTDTMQEELDDIRQKYDDELVIVKNALDRRIITLEQYKAAEAKINAKAREESQAAEGRNAKNRLDKFERLYKQQERTLRDARITEYLTEEEFNDQKVSERRAFIASMLKDLKLSEEDRQSLEDEFAELDLQKREEDYEKKKQLNQTYIDAVENLSETLGNTMAQMFSGEEEAFHNFMKQILLTAISAIEQYVELAYVKVLLDGILSGGISLIGGLVQLAAIKTAFAFAKGLVNNFYTGGFTGQGRWNEPKGVVHSDEFVANRFAVANPSVRPVLDLIDKAQQRGQVGNLTGDDLAAVAGATPGEGGASPSPRGRTKAGTPSGETAAMVAIISRMSAVIARLERRLKEPFVAVASISGRDGIKNRMDEYERLIKNKSRL